MLKIVSVRNQSPAAQLGLIINDQIVAINGNKIGDKLDFTFYIQAEDVEMEILRAAETIKLKITDNQLFSESDWGVELEDYKIKNCGNNCIFCFVHQNPEGLRKTIYVKDEDYRFSFLYGSYFTLTNITKAELERIVAMRLSPLYVSVHATDPNTRKLLLGIKKNDNILDKLDYLIANGIQLHTQVVMCPEVNDGKILEQTVLDLAARYPGIASVAVVPVGKTRYRDDLPHIKSVDAQTAAATIDLIDRLQSQLLIKLATRFVFAADEFYLRAGIAIPTDEYYEDFEQYENGIGLVRTFLNELTGFKKKLPASLKKQKNIFLVSGKAFAPVLSAYLLPFLQKINKLTPVVIQAENRLFGPEVTVAGLLCGADLLAAIEGSELKPDLIILPPTCLNYDNLFLDDMSFADFCHKTDAKVELYSGIDRIVKLVSGL